MSYDWFLESQWMAGRRGARGSAGAAGRQSVDPMTGPRVCVACGHYESKHEPRGNRLCTEVGGQRGRHAFGCECPGFKPPAEPAVPAVSHFGIRLLKTCSCEGATASGPRTVVRGLTEHSSGVVVFEATLHAMACDRCDAPWRYDPTPSQEPLADYAKELAADARIIAPLVHRQLENAVDQFSARAFTQLREQVAQLEGELEAAEKHVEIARKATAQEHEAAERIHEAAERMQDRARTLGLQLHNAEARGRRLEAAVLWALGMDGDFPVRDSSLVVRGGKPVPKDGPYWWRTELRRRAGLDDEQAPERGPECPDGAQCGHHCDVGCWRAGNAGALSVASATGDWQWVLERWWDPRKRTTVVPGTTSGD